jgi:predicted  nucleic acid-binding Zn-ribbon protein
VADPLQTLLDVQAHDLSADQLRHRKATLPERLALAEQQAAMARLDTELGELRGRLLDLERSQKRIEDEVATLAAKSEAENKRLYSGTVTSPRELQAMQEEIDGLARRQRELEDEVLEIMEAAEPLHEEVDRLEGVRDGHAAEAERLGTVIAAAEAEIDGELEGVLGERNQLASAIPEDLLATYERLRDRLGGIGVARLEGTQCMGCHLSIPATEVDAIRHATPGAVVFHEECGRILVRG